MSLHYLYTMLLHYTVYSRRLFSASDSSRREQAPDLRYDSIITQIGRGNKFSAEFLLLRTVEDACPYKCCVKLPYEKEPKISLFSYYMLFYDPQSFGRIEIQKHGGRIIVGAVGGLAADGVKLLSATEAIVARAPCIQPFFANVIQILAIAVIIHPKGATQGKQAL